MNLATALLTAKRRATMWQEPRYVVIEDDEYHVAKESELDNYWQGQRVLYTVLPNGEVLS